MLYRLYPICHYFLEGHACGAVFVEWREKYNFLNLRILALHTRWVLRASITQPQQQENFRNVTGEKMDAFAARLNAAEGAYFMSEQRTATERHLQKLVEQGKVPQNAIAAISEAASLVQKRFLDVPVTVINSKPQSEVRGAFGVRLRNKYTCATVRSRLW